MFNNNSKKAELTILGVTLPTLISLGIIGLTWYKGGFNWLPVDFIKRQNDGTAFKYEK